ncbi:MAG: hypothetical protein LH618_12460, partial [Saprospiraceae bacterium]|nr:hypothetical protein [Saprospiraceae bacterium]
MEPRLFRLIFFLFLLAFSPPTGLWGQATDLRQDKAFFQKKRVEYGQWLRQNKLDHIFRADSIAVTNQKVTLYLIAAYQGAHVCDSLQSAWQELEKANRRVNGQYFHERLLHKWAFLAEIRQDQAEVVVRCHSPAHFMARITSKNGQVPVEGFNIRSAAVMQVDIPPSLSGVNNGDNTATLIGKKVGPICAKARGYLVNLYKDKGTPILWKARVDSSYTTFDEFVLEITHLNNEICPDGYFEYHRIYVKGLQKGDN